MTNWNYADVWETVADVRPDAIAVTQGDHHLSWRDFDRGADGVAQYLLDQNVVQQDKMAVYLYNCPEYLQACFAAVKVGLVPVNTNYRYGDDELSYLWSNADAVAVVFHGAFVDRVERIRDRVPDVRAWLWVDDGSGPCPDWAIPYERAAKSATRHVAAPWGRSGDDLLMIYTGGTTGMPKGVMWRQDDLFARLINGGSRQYPLDGGIEAVRQSLMADTAPPPCCRPARSCTAPAGSPPTSAWPKAGRIVLLSQPPVRPGRAARYGRAREGERPRHRRRFLLTPAGGRAERPARTLGSELLIHGGLVGGHVERSDQRRVAGHHSGMLLVDTFSSSEAIGLGMSVSGAGSAVATAKFTLGPDVKVLKRTAAEVAPGSDEIGVLALGGRNPLGYYKDEEKSDRTFKTIDGVRYSVPGDFAQVDTDGTIHLLGRGSVCINSGGEKIFPEEVEEVAQDTPGRTRCRRRGHPTPDIRGGDRGRYRVGGRRRGDAAHGSRDHRHVKQRLSGYKAPRRVRLVDTIGRAPNGKVDYRRHRAESIEDFETTA